MFKGSDYINSAFPVVNLNWKFSVQQWIKKWMSAVRDVACSKSCDAI